MTRYFFAFILVVSVALLGVLPHATMATGSHETSATCHQELNVSGAHSPTIDQCDASDQSMSGACASACLGTTAIWSSASDPAPMTYRPVLHRLARSPILHGRSGETAERPPRSI